MGKVACRKEHDGSRNIVQDSSNEDRYRRSNPDRSLRTRDPAGQRTAESGIDSAASVGPIKLLFKLGMRLCWPGARASGNPVVPYLVLSGLVPLTLSAPIDFDGRYCRQVSSSVALKVHFMGLYQDVDAIKNTSIFEKLLL